MKRKHHNSKKWSWNVFDKVNNMQRTQILQLDNIFEDNLENNNFCFFVQFHSIPQAWGQKYATKIPVGAFFL